MKIFFNNESEMKISNYPLVSVIIPVYNSEKYIADAIESVYQQTYTNIELIVVDDGSTDGSYHCIKNKFEHNYTTVKTYYYRQENQGPSSARNYGIKKSSGTYICFLDADDLYHQTKVDKQVRFLENHPSIAITYNDVQVVDEKLNNLNVLLSEGDFPDKSTFLTNLLFRQFIPAPAGIMMHRKCFQKVTYNPCLIFAEDYDFLLRLAEHFNFGYQPGTYYICRRHANNLTNAHHKQVESERDIILSLGLDEIRRLVFSSCYNMSEKVLMYAKILYKIGNIKCAKQQLESLLSETKNAYVYFYLGNILFMEKSFQEASNVYKKCLQISNNLAETHNNLGCCLVRLNRFGEAITLFENAVKLRDNYLDAKHNLFLAINYHQTGYRFTERELRIHLLDYQD